MKGTGYIVDTSILASMPPEHHWQASQSLIDPTKSILAIEWEASSDVVGFESQPGVVPIGERWESPSSEVASLLAHFYDAPLDAAATTTTIVTVDVAPPPPDTVHAALKKVSWAGARLIG